MSELKVYHCNEWHNEYTEFYLKYEADKVIADLEESHKMEVEQLLIEIVGLKNELQAANEQIENLVNSASSIMLFQDKVMDNKCAELRHHKYKRCLAMAWWCSAELGVLVSTWESKIKYYKRWQKRWLELAEVFKETK